MPSRSRACAHIEAEILVNQSRTDAEAAEVDVFDLIKWRLGELLFESNAYKTHYAEDAIQAKAAELDEEG